jgi:hypothetical protein
MIILRVESPLYLKQTSFIRNNVDVEEKLHSAGNAYKLLTAKVIYLSVSSQTQTEENYLASLLRSAGRNVGYNVAHLQLSAATKTTFGMHKGAYAFQTSKAVSCGLVIGLACASAQARVIFTNKFEQYSLEGFGTPQEGWAIVNSPIRSGNYAASSTLQPTPYPILISPMANDNGL